MGSYDKTQTLYEKGVSNIVKHEHYIHDVLANDIALIELDSAADLSGSHISVIALVDRLEDIYTGQPLQAAGWGLTDGKCGLHKFIGRYRILKFHSYLHTNSLRFILATSTNERLERRTQMMGHSTD